MPTVPGDRRNRLVRVLGLLTALAWIGVTWTFWHTHSVRPRQSLPLDLPIRAFPRVPAGSSLAVINDSWDELAFFDAATGQKEVVRKGSLQGIRGAILTRDRHAVWTFHDDGSVKIWNMTETGKPVTLQLPEHRTVLDVSPDGNMVAVAAGVGKDSKVELWDVALQERVATFACWFHDAQSTGFFPDGQTLATITPDGVQLWDVRTHAPRFLLIGRFRGFAIAPDGRSLVTWDTRDRLTFWDTTTSLQQASYDAPGHVFRMFFSPDSGKVCLDCFEADSAPRWLFQMGIDIGPVLDWFLIPRVREKAAVLDVATGEECGRVPCYRGQVVFADGNTLTTVTRKGALELWDLPPRTAVHPLVADVCLGVAVLLTGVWWYAWRARRRMIDAI